MRDPDISLVVPLYSVEPYLPAFLASLDAQRSFAGRWDVVFVDDGSPDGSARIVEAWLGARPGRGALIRQANRGVSVARNEGLRHVRGRWVSFPDPDDVLSPGYLRAMWRFLSRKGADATIVAARVLRLDDAIGRVRDRHPLRFRFDEGDRVVDMAGQPDHFQLSAASTFFRLSDIRSTGVEFPPTLSISEDALFIATMLLRVGTARLGVVRSARYLYRKRASADSAVDRHRMSRAAYVDRFIDGYVPLLRQAEAAGEVPPWLQSMVLYEAQWILPRLHIPHERLPEFTPAEAEAARDAWRACSAFLSVERILQYDATALPVEVRFALLALKGVPLPEWTPVLADRIPGGWRTRVYQAGAHRGSSADEGADGKIRTIRYFVETPLVERVRWLVPAGSHGGEGGGLDAAQRLDLARRSAMGQRRLALAARFEDLTVHRVRAPARRHPIAWLRQLATVTWRWLRRGPVSVAFAVRVAGRLGAGRTLRDSWLIDGADPDLAKGLCEGLRRRGVPVHMVPPAEFRGTRRLRLGSLPLRAALQDCQGVIAADVFALASLRRNAYADHVPSRILVGTAPLGAGETPLVRADPAAAIVTTEAAYRQLAEEGSDSLLSRSRLVLVSQPDGDTADAIAGALAEVIHGFGRRAD